MRLVFGVIFLFASWTVAAQTPPARRAPVSDAVKRGEYLVRIGSCHDCHTPLKMGPRGPEPDMANMLSGHPATLIMGPAPALSGNWMFAGSTTSTAFVGPWGTSYAINLTSHDSGLGKWTEAMFVEAMRKGKHAGVGRPILPPMPWQSLNAMTDSDLKAVFAYLRSLPPNPNLPPPSVAAPPPPAKR